VACSDATNNSVDPGVDAGTDATTPGAKYAVGGTVSGLTASGLVLDNGGDTVTLSNTYAAFNSLLNYSRRRSFERNRCDLNAAEPRISSIFEVRPT
jgi:hypothetical protein